VFEGIGGTLRGVCTGRMGSVGAADVAGLIVAVAAGVMEGVVLNGTEGEGRTLAGGEALATGDAVAAGVGGGAEGAIEGVALGVALGDGRILTVGEAARVGLAAVVAVAAGVAVATAAAVGAGVAVAAAVGIAVALAAGVALAAAAAVAAAVGAGVAVVVAVSRGLTNFFGGALGGGVASARIRLRARSAAARSAIAVQPVSIVTSITRSFTVRGRGISGTSTIAGTETSSSSPRTVAENSASARDCRRKRYRSIGRRL
jgi:hypothetical protein